MTFRKAIDEIPVIRDRLEPGLQALKTSERSSISIPDTRRLRGSVDVDSALVSSYPNDPRWDYVVGYSQSSGADYAVGVEFHPAASSRNIKELAQKGLWMNRWLQSDGRPLGDLCDGRVELYWVPTGKVGFRKGGREEKILAQAGVHFPVREVELP